MLKRILILDDNQDILEMVTEVLSYENFNVHGTSDSSDIINVAESYEPHLVILDYRLSDGNGGDICMKLKAHKQFKDIPVIIFSAYVNKAVDFNKYGCDAVISKPFDISELLDKVNNLINLS